MEYATTVRLLGVSFLLFSSAAASQLPVVNNAAGFGPQGATVGTPVGNQLTINQTQDRAIVNWHSFSIDAGHKVHFNQEAHQAILNRVTGTGASELHGELTAGGTVWLINPNGVLIGNTGRIETRSFIASTLNINDANFLDNPSTVNLQGDSTGVIQNLGSITATGGDVFLVARQVDNRGEINAAEGRVGLAAGNQVELTLHEASSPIFVRTALEGVASEHGVNHEGVIAAARAELVAAGGNIYGMAVNISGQITSKHIDLYADRLQMGPDAVLRANGEGGSIHLEASHMTLAGELQSLGSENTIYFSQVESLDAADARIEARSLVLENVSAGNLGNEGNAFEQLRLTAWASEEAPAPGDLFVNSGRGSLDVYSEGKIRHQNLTLISEGDLLLGDYAASIGASERAVLASLQGKLLIDLPEDGGFAETPRVRLYSREESEISGLEPDNSVAYVVFPADPDEDSRVAFYRIIDAPAPDPDPEPAPDPTPEPNPEPTPQPAPSPAPGPQPDAGEDTGDPDQESESVAAERERLRQNAAHQQQTSAGGPFLITVDPSTGLAYLRLVSVQRPGTVVGSSAPIMPNQGLVNVYPSTTAVPDDRSEPAMDSLFDILQLTQNPDVIAALLANKAMVEAENAAFLESLTGGVGTPGENANLSDEEKLSRYRQNMENLIRAVLANSSIDEQTAQQLIDQIIAQNSATRDANGNPDAPVDDRSAELSPETEQRHQEQLQRQEQLEQKRQQAQQQLEQRRQEQEQKSSNLKAQLEQRRQELEEQNRQAAQEKKDEALRKLNERSPTPAPVQMGGQ